MCKKYSTLALTVLIIHLFAQFSVFAQTQNDKNSHFALNIKNKIAKAGTNPNRKTKIRLIGNTKLVGYITEIKDDHFALLDDKSGKIVSVDYAQVIEVKQNKGVPKAFRTMGYAALGTGVAVGVLILLGLAASHID